ncbi:MAG TPA: metallophosphoesterase [Nannocystis sp.]
MRNHRFVPAIAAWLGAACASGGPGDPSAANNPITTAYPADVSVTAGDEADSGTTEVGSGSDGDTGGTTDPGASTTSTTGASASSGAGESTSTGAAPGGDSPDPPPGDPGEDGGGTTGNTTGGDLPEGGTTGDTTGDTTGTTDGEAMPVPPPEPPGNATDENLLVAIMGDQGSGKNTNKVYQLIASEGADMLIILGDFDYGDDPDGWAADMKAALGEDFPVFGLIGNHDKSKWSGYQARLQDRLAKIPGATCTGDLGVKSSCTYRGFHFILSGLGTKGSDSEHEKFFAQDLAADDSLWKLCAMHKNMRDLQAGDKGDDLTWKALQSCQDAGAIIAMGHEHSYARTLTLTAVGDKSKGHGATGLPDLLEVSEGSTFSVVSGLGGKSIRAYDAGLHKNDSWWASIYTKDYYLKNGVEVDNFDATYGVLFIRFHVEGDPRLAHGYFKNIQGDIIDEFDVVRK